MAQRIPVYLIISMPRSNQGTFLPWYSYLKSDRGIENLLGDLRWSYSPQEAQLEARFKDKSNS